MFSLVNLCGCANKFNCQLALKHNLSVMYLVKILLLALLPCINSQHEMLYFPDDNGALIGNDNIVKIPPNLTQIRGTSLYENYVDRIISGGIAKLTLAINKVLLRTRTNERDNIVFAPMSIAGALALVLLGSNGKTFEEITSVMGLATGLEIQSKSEQVHEQFGRLLTKLQATAGFNLGQQLSIASAIFVQSDYPIRTVYKETAEQIYQSEILNVDFKTNSNKAHQTINAWVSDRTNGKIRDILGEVPSISTKVIIASAMYFKAEWAQPFFEGSTAKRPFFTNGRKTASNIQVEMMANGGEFPYHKDLSLKCEILGFPYKGNATVMYVVMPFNSNTERLKELENLLTPGDLEKLADSTVYTDAVLIFPKMRMESTIDLKAPLERLGVKTLFNPAQANLALLSPGEGDLAGIPSVIASADNYPLSPNNLNDGSVLIFSRFGATVNCSNIFDPSTNISVCQETVNNTSGSSNGAYKKFGRRIARKISNVGSKDGTLDGLRHIINSQSSENSYQNPGLYADKVIHKVYMDITETGTEAAAATSVSLSRDGGRLTFRVDVPFFFFIRHEETKTILFWGSVNSPTPNYKIV